METVPLLHQAACQLHIKGKTITRSIANNLHRAYTYESSTTHLTNRLNLHSTYRASIAWTEFARAFKSFPVGSQRILRRWIYGFLPTQLRLQRAGTGASPECPICKQHPKTDEHFLTCGGAPTWKEYFLEPLDKLLHKQNAGHWIAAGLRTNIVLFLNRQPPQSPTPWIQPAIESQTELGWKSVFSGIFSTSWAHFQNLCNPLGNGSTLVDKPQQLTPPPHKSTRNQTPTTYANLCTLSPTRQGTPP